MKVSIELICKYVVLQVEALSLSIDVRNKSHQSNAGVWSFGIDMLQSAHHTDIEEMLWMTMD